MLELQATEGNEMGELVDNILSSLNQLDTLVKTRINPEKINQIINDRSKFDSILQNTGYSENQGEGLYACKSFIYLSTNWDDFKSSVETKLRPLKSFEPVLNEINRVS